MPPVWINEGGTWREATQIYANNGSWIDVNAQWAKDDTGQWRKVFEKGGAGPIPSPFVGTYGFYGYNSSNYSGRIIIADRDASGAMTEIANFTTLISSTKFSPDGNMLLVVEPDTTGQIRVRHRNASNFGTVTQSISYGVGNGRPVVTWSEDGLLALVAYKRESVAPYGWVCAVYTRASTATTTLTPLGPFHSGVLESDTSFDLMFSISPDKQMLVIWSSNGGSGDYIRAYPYTGTTYSGTAITVPTPPNWEQTRSFAWSADGSIAVMGYREIMNSRPGFLYTSGAYSYSISGGVFTLGSEVGSVSSNTFGTTFALFNTAMLAPDNTYHVFRYAPPGADTNFPRWEQISGTSFAPLPPNTIPVIASVVSSFGGDPYYDRNQNIASLYLEGSGYNDTFEAYSVGGELIIGPALPAYPPVFDVYDSGGRMIAPYTTAPPYG